jgi:hypothetical protein
MTIYVRYLWKLLRYPAIIMENRLETVHVILIPLTIQSNNVSQSSRSLINVITKIAA